MRSDILYSVALVALYSSSAVAGPIDFLKRSESSEYGKREATLNHRGLTEIFSGLGLGGAKGEGNAKPPAAVQPPQEIGMGIASKPNPAATGVALPPVGTAPPLATGVAPPLGTGISPPIVEASPPPFANETAAVPPQATACPPAQTVTMTVTETVNGGGAATPPPAANPPAEQPVTSPPPAASNPPKNPPPVASSSAAKPPAAQPLPTEVVTTIPLAPIDPTASTVITATGLALAKVATTTVTASPPPAANPAGGINANIEGIGGSNGNSGTINNVQIIVIQFTQPGTTQTITSTVNGNPITETITQPPSTVLSTITMTEGAAATGTDLPAGAEVISNFTVPAVPAAPYALGNETVVATGTGVLPTGTGILPQPGAIETGAAVHPSPTASAGILPPPGAVESGIFPPGAVDTGVIATAPIATAAHHTPVTPVRVKRWY